MKFSLFFIFLMTSLLSWAQPEDAQIEVIDGKRYYIHIVQSGNTLYGIHRLYKTPVEEIIAANPEAAKGLSEGQRILVPIKGIESLPINIVIYKVEAKETLYGISKKFETSVEKLVELNPGIEEGINVGQELKVPVKLPVGKGEELKEKQERLKISFSDSIIEHKVRKGETLYSISKRYMVPVNDLKKLNELKNDRVRKGDIIRIPVKKERIEKVEIREVIPLDSVSFEDTLVIPNDSIVLFEKKEEYNIAILMPLYLDRQEGYSSNVANLAAEYYMGTRFALDSLKALGLKAKVFIQDSKKDSTTMDEILAQPEFENIDLIIGPFFANEAEIVSKWCKDHGVRMICPVATKYEILRNNPYIYESVTSDITLAEGLAKYVYNEKDSTQIILVKPQDTQDQLINDGFRSAFNSMASNKDSLPKIIETSFEDFNTFVAPNKNAHIVFLSTDKSEVEQFFAKLGTATEENETGAYKVYGTKEWGNYTNLESAVLSKFQAHFATPYNLNYKNDRTKNFDKNYRRTYRTQVSKMALQGYDVTMFFCQDLLLGKKPTTGIMNVFKLEQKGEGNGYENVACFIMKHNDYGFKKIFQIND